MVENTNKSKDSTNMIIGGIVVVAIACAIGIGIKNKVDDENKYMDTLRKCTVMEAADIYNTGVGGNKNTAFTDAKETCLDWYVEWGKEDFYKAVDTDWETRKSEVIEDKELNYYLNTLGW